VAQKIEHTIRRDGLSGLEMKPKRFVSSSHHQQSTIINQSSHHQAIIPSLCRYKKKQHQTADAREIRRGEKDKEYISETFSRF
jgi:hypothetical protein